MFVFQTLLHRGHLTFRDCRRHGVGRDFQPRLKAIAKVHIIRQVSMTLVTGAHPFPYQGYTEHITQTIPLL
jgi:hypothetical protein